MPLPSAGGRARQRSADAGRDSSLHRRAHGGAIADGQGQLTAETSSGADIWSMDGGARHRSASARAQRAHTKPRGSSGSRSPASLGRPEAGTHFTIVPKPVLRRSMGLVPQALEQMRAEACRCQHRLGQEARRKSVTADRNASLTTNAPPSVYYDTMVPP